MTHLRSHRLGPAAVVLRGLTVLLALFAFACDSDSPTAPEQNPPPATPGTPVENASVTVTANPNELDAGGDTFSTITVSVRLANGALPTNGTTVVVRTSLGSLGGAATGLQSVALELTNGTASVQLFPGLISGTAIVQAELSGSIGQTSVRIAGAAEEGDPDRFFLEAVSPNSGSPNGGEVVRITGGGFLEPVRVLIGGKVAEVLNVRSNVIRVRTPPIQLPAGEFQTVDVSVTNDFNGELQQSDTLPGVFTYTRGGVGGPLQPVIFSVTPGSGPNEGGTRVVIEGDGFESPIQVIFGTGSSPNQFSGVEAEIVSFSATRIVVIAPAATAFGQGNLNSEVSILVRNIASGSAVIQSSAFRYGVDVLITSIAPSEGPYIGGTLVTIFGQGFDEPVAVVMGTVAQRIISVTGTEIIVSTVGIDPADCTDVTGATQVTNIETGDSATGFPFTYRVESATPQILSVNPGTGGAGDTVTLRGSNLSGAVDVSFEGAERYAATILSNDGSTIRVQVPFLPLAEFDIEECNENGGESGERFVPTSVNVNIENLTTTCTSTRENAFVFQPSDTSCRNDPPPEVDPVEPPEASFDFEILDEIDGTVQFIDTSTGNPTSWRWDFENDSDNDSTEQFPVHTYGAPGVYSVRLEVRNAGGSDATVVVITIPSP